MYERVLETACACNRKSSLVKVILVPSESSARVLLLCKLAQKITGY
jgi:hypothetical protein